MQRALLEILRCPACRGLLRTVEYRGDDVRLTDGELECERCGHCLPVVHGFGVFLDRPAGGPDRERFEAVRDRRFGAERDYAAFLHAKRRRPSVDLYAAFRPFNESSRTFAPMFPVLRELLRPGDRILDLWCRTGWTGEWLGAEFPEQRVVSVWESGSDVLGTRGFRYWLGDQDRRPNLDVVFHDPNEPLPFADDAFAVVHGLDTLHRYSNEVLVPECLRVCRPDGVVAFPHVHLTNGDPDPFFERGETQRHGTDYERAFGERLAGTDLRAFVMSERRLFDEADGTALHDEPDMVHYNAAVVIAPSRFAERELAQEPKSLATHADARAALNPLVQIDPSSGATRVERAALHGGVGDLLFRHPPYHERLERVLPARLQPLERRLVYWARRGLTVSEIAAQLARDPEEVLTGLLALERAEVLRLHAISPAMARLQTYYETQCAPPPDDAATVTALWETAVARTPDAPYLVWAEDGSAFTYADTDQLALQVAGCLRARGVGRGDRVLVHAVSHPEFALAFLGAARLGAVVAAVDPQQGRERLEHVVRTLGAKLAIVRPGGEVPFGCPVLHMSAGDDEVEPSFLEAALSATPPEELPALSPDDPAVVLFTSGSTGVPKGVLLSHGGLYRSSEVVDRVYRWTAEDRYHCPGPPNTMSAFRNAFLTPLHSGARVVLAEHAAAVGPMAVLATCLDHGVTILNTTPAFLAYCAQLERRAESLREHRIRMLLCTGATLQAGLRRRFEEVMGATVFDYYGLTETSGACTFVGPEDAQLAEPGIGRPVGALAFLVDADGVDVPDGEVGELLIETDSLALGYVTPTGCVPNERVRDGRLHTGDLARLNADGCLVLVGRGDRMLVDRAGENLYPEEVERALDALPGVVTSHVTARRRGDVEELVALVVPDRAAGAGGAGWAASLRAGLRATLSPAHVPTTLIELDDPLIAPSGGWNSAAVQEILASHP